ncbi:MAG: hypothetical protein H7A05_06560 [Pseudomonadales bacterium]|nr:hypothetical protein [Pseudomonadales bacterium]
MRWVYTGEAGQKYRSGCSARKIESRSNHYHAHENEDQNVTLSTLEALCQVFHADIAELFPPLETTRVYSSGVPLGLGVPERGSAATVHDEPAEHKTSTGKRGRKKTPSPARK